MACDAVIVHCEAVVVILLTPRIVVESQEKPQAAAE